MRNGKFRFFSGTVIPENQNGNPGRWVAVLVSNYRWRAGRPFTVARGGTGVRFSEAPLRLLQFRTVAGGIVGGDAREFTFNRALFLRLQQLAASAVEAIPNFRQEVALTVTVKHHTSVSLILHPFSGFTEANGRLVIPSPLWIVKAGRQRSPGCFQFALDRSTSGIVL